MVSRRLLRIKIVKALYSHFKSESDSLIASEKEFFTSVDKCHQLYHLMLRLSVDVADYARGRIEIAKKKHLPTKADLNPNLRFADNRVIEALRTDERLNSYLEKHSLSWAGHPELVKTIYNNLIEKDYYKKYMASATDSFESDLKFMVGFYTFEIEDLELMEQVVEEDSIYWADDIEFTLGSVIRTINKMKQGGKLELMPLFKSNDEPEFAKAVFRGAIVNQAEYLEYINKYSSNWDLDRIAYMDTMIMLAAVSEILNCPTVPISVTLDEYLEIAKFYSTPSSTQFINGVLDKIVEMLRAENKINKTDGDDDDQ